MCNLDRFKKEAQEKGMTLLAKGEKRGSYIYQFDKCGHKRECQPSELRKTQPFCEVCQLDNFKKEAKEKEMTLLAKGEKCGLYIYQFDKCGHKREYTPSDLRRTHPVCEICQLDNFKKEAKDKEMTLLAKGEKRRYYLYQFDKCGHKKEYTPADLRKCQPVCEICQLDNFKKEAKDKEMTLLSKGEKRGSYIYQFDKCSHKREYQPADLRRTHPVCEICGESHFHNKSNIYLLHIYNNENSFLKFGVANYIETRIKYYKLDKSYKVKILNSVLLDSKYTAISYEQNIHKKFGDNKLNPDVMSDIMESGYTECYPVMMVDSLLNEIAKIQKYLENEKMDIAA